MATSGRERPRVCAQEPPLRQPPRCSERPGLRRLGRRQKHKSNLFPSLSQAGFHWQEPRATDRACLSLQQHGAGERGGEVVHLTGSLPGSTAIPGGATCSILQGTSADGGCFVGTTVALQRHWVLAPLIAAPHCILAVTSASCLKIPLVEVRELPGSVKATHPESHQTVGARAGCVLAWSVFFDTMQFSLAVPVGTNSVS